MKEGLVYLIVEVDQNGQEKYKIGITKKDPMERLKKLKTGNSNSLHVINTYRSENYRRIEKWLHKKYGNQKTISNNEFFYLNNFQALNFQKDCKEIDNIISALKENNPFFK